MYVVAPLAFKSTCSPTQIFPFEAVGFNTGIGITVTSLVVLAVHVAASPINVYKVLTTGDADTLAPNAELKLDEGLQV